MRDLISSMAVSIWARVLAWVFLAALVLAGYAVAQPWLKTGHFLVSVPSVFSIVALAYISVLFAWVAFTGKVPRFFPIGALRWPFRPPNT